jgi:hypothetical protein
VNRFLVTRYFDQREKRVKSEQRVGRKEKGKKKERAKRRMTTSLPLYRCTSCNRVYCSCVDRYGPQGAVCSSELSGSFSALVQGPTNQARMTSPRSDRFSLPMLIPKQMHRQQHAAVNSHTNSAAVTPRIPGVPSSGQAVELPPISGRPAADNGNSGQKRLA